VCDSIDAALADMAQSRDITMYAYTIATARCWLAMQAKTCLTAVATP
jgi:hypothetical protein